MIDYHRLVEPLRVHGSLYSDAEVFADEMERIFLRGWVFVGHESEIPHPGDWVRRALGLEPVIMVRDADGAVLLYYGDGGHGVGLLVAG